MKNKSQKTIRIGSGAGYSGDRIEPALALAKEGRLDYLVFECLAERTIALAQGRKIADPGKGYDPLLEARMRKILPVCSDNGTKIITNMGAANPIAAMNRTAEIAHELGIKKLKIAAVTGDDVLNVVLNDDYSTIETGISLHDIKEHIISANAYLGAGGLVEALGQGADIVITGRVADPVLFTAPLVHCYNWSFEDHDLMGQAIVLGHLMECGSQVCGGYFADPGYKDVPDLENIGFPIAEVKEDGSFRLSKLPHTGGILNPASCKEQLLYEIHDPTRYLTPDVIADFSQVCFTETGKDEVEVAGGKGIRKSGQLKVSVGYRDGFIGEGQISYGGPGALSRGRLALDIVKKRLADISGQFNELRTDIIGMNALYGDNISHGNPYEVRVRVAARAKSREAAVQVGNEVESLYTNGPAGGGGATKSVEEVVAIQSVLIDASLAPTKVIYKSL